MIEKIKTWLTKNQKELARFYKFLVVGTIGALVDFTTLNILLTPISQMVAGDGALHTLLLRISQTPEDFGPTIASTLSFILAVLSNFLWNRFWVYPDSRSKPLGRQLAQFFLVNLTGIPIRVPIVTFTHKPFTRLISGILPALKPQAGRLGSNMALALAVGIVLFWNFFINRVWTYNDVE